MSRKRKYSDEFRIKEEVGDRGETGDGSVSLQLGL